MKSTALVTAIALLATAFSIAANAQTGRPAEAPSDRPSQVSIGDAQVGSYARYLMLNGTPRDVAIKAAANVDHPAPSTRFALRTLRARGAATAPAQQ